MKLEEKYPEAYFEHWLLMLSTMEIALSKQGFENQLKNYLNFEGEEEMRKLQKEVLQIVQSKDLNGFERVAKRFDIKGINEQSLNLMAEVIINWN